MTRISANLLVQRVDDQLVIIDESVGEEIVVPIDLVLSFTKAVVRLFPDGPKRSAAVPPREPDLGHDVG